MTSLNNRLDGLDDHLSPTEIVLRQLREIARISSTLEYVDNLKKSDWPLQRMTRQARRAVTKAMKGCPRDSIDRHADEAERDVAFLWNLYLQLNRRIHDDLRTALPMLILLVSDLRYRALDYDRRADAASAWMRACRDLPYPLDARTAAAVEAAIAHQVESWSVLNDGDTIDEWVYEELGDQDPDGVLDESASRISRRVERELRRLVRSNEIQAGRVVSLLDSPHPFLVTAPLVEGHWIDVTVLELAELGSILTESGCTPRGSGDLHPLAWEEFVKPDAHGELSPIGDATWNDAREAATERVRSYRGRRRRFDNRDYVNLALYQRWRYRSLGARLDASIDNGFVVSSWNDWVMDRGLKAVLAGIRVEPIKPFAQAGAWTVHDAGTARRLQSNRKDLLRKLRHSISVEPTSTDGRRTADAVGIRWRDGAAHVLTRIDGLAAAVEGIRSKQFRNSEIVFTELVEDLNRYRADLREVLDLFESQRHWGDPVLGSLAFRALGHDGEPANSKRSESILQQIEPSIVKAGRRIAKEIIREARFDAFIYVRDKDAAERIIDEELDEFLS